MASITDVRLSVGQDLADANIQIDTDIGFDAFDLASNQVYQLFWKLIGPDRLPGEDDTLVAQGDGDVVRLSAQGRTTITHQLTFTIPLKRLSDDPSRGDELRAVVTLTPVGPFGDSEESNKVRLASPVTAGAPGS
jgi:hypothetical protein